MAKLREITCKSYKCKGQCEKGRKAEHHGYCQKCDKYVPRARVRCINRKKQALDKIRKNDNGE